MTLCYSKIFMLAHFTIAIQDHIIPQTKKDDDIQAVIVNEEAAKPFFSWPFGASDSSKNMPYPCYKGKINIGYYYHNIKSIVYAIKKRLIFPLLHGYGIYY